MIEKVRQISDENQQSHEREKSLQDELSSRLTKEREVSANIEVFKNSLQKLQVLRSQWQLGESGTGCSVGLRKGQSEGKTQL